MKIELIFQTIMIIALLVVIVLSTVKTKTKKNLDSRLFDKDKHKQTSSINPHIKSIVDDYVD